VVCFTSNSTNI